MSKIPPVIKVKEPLWTTIRRGWRPYKRLYSYALPYKWRFIVGLGFGFLYGMINSCLPAGHGASVAGAVFHGHAPMAPQQMIQHPEVMNHGPEDQFDLVLLCLAIPAVMTAAQPLQLRQCLLHELGQQQGADRHPRPALQQDDSPVDGFL